MHILMQSRLGWHDHAITTEHDIGLDFTVEVTDVFQSADPVSELVVRGAEIRREITLLLANENLVQVLAGTNRPVATEEPLQTKSHMRWKAHWIFSQKKGGNPTPRIRGEVQGRINLVANRRVHPIQALECARTSVADGIAELIMGTFRHHLHGTTSTSWESDLTIKDGRLTHVETDERTSDDHLQN
jgi:hypothetical protein